MNVPEDIGESRDKLSTTGYASIGLDVVSCTKLHVYQISV